MRDEFNETTKRTIAHRAGHRCSNPACGVTTSGPASDPSGRLNLGVAAHIAAAAPGGPRFDEGMSAKARTSASNGIWLCQTCAKLVDDDVLAHPTQTLLAWKSAAEISARAAIGKSTTGLPAAKEIIADGAGSIGRDVLLLPGAQDETIIADGSVGERIVVTNGAIGESITTLGGGKGKTIIQRGIGPALQIICGEGGGTGLRITRM